MEPFYHEPVLVKEVLHYLVTDPKGRYIDGTIGGGGHAFALLSRFPEATLVALDRDPEALEAAGRHLKPFGSRVEFVHSDLGDIEPVMQELGGPRAVGMLMDLGVSSRQLDSPERGFSYLQSAPLRLALDRDADFDARQYLDAVEVESLRGILRTYGDVPLAGKTARAMKRARAEGKLETTVDLQSLLRRIGQGSPRRLSQVFQALRMVVNDEMGSLRRGLAGIANLLEEGGRVVVISFESIMDREVKRTLKPQRMGRPLPNEPDPDPVWEVLTKSVVRAGSSEVDRNPRSRSARLRAARRTGHVD